jgi:glycyl-tRNA synthetase alpha chain
VTLQDLIFKLSEFWSARGCIIQQPLDTEMGAGTMHPETFLRVLGPTHWNVAYVQPSRRPADGRFGENPNRLFKHHQFQVILKPAPDDVQHLYLQSLEACGIDLGAHDVRFEEDNWESPTLGAWGIGWQVLYDGLEITQFTYFQQAGGQDLSPISVELTYGLERFAMALQGVDNVFDLQWSPGVTYRQVRFDDEVQQSKYAFGQVGESMSPAEFSGFHRDLFERYHAFGSKLAGEGLVLPALDYCLKSSHVFNVLDASGGIGVTERTGYILRVRQLAVAIAKAHVELGASQGGSSLDANKPTPPSKEPKEKTTPPGADAR